MSRDTIRHIWSEELELTEFSDDDDFFALGGHSLIMTRIQSRFRQELGIVVPMDQLFRHSTLASVAEYIERSAATA